MNRNVELNKKKKTKISDKAIKNINKKLNKTIAVSKYDNEMFLDKHYNLYDLYHSSFYQDDYKYKSYFLTKPIW